MLPTPARSHERGYFGRANPPRPRSYERSYLRSTCDAPALASLETCATWLGTTRKISN
jgi:hypothetical protein